jgi:ubiquinone/menaquinone biosynthesis C-methylase UbiE
MMKRWFMRVLAAFLRVFFSWLYHQGAFAYDGVAAIVSIGLWRKWVLSVLPDLPGPRVLEVGHGPGHLQIALKKAGVTAYGLDESRQMGYVARRRLLRQGHSPALARGLAQSMPFPNETFDQVVATFPSEYITDPHTLGEIYRVLKPGGSAILLPIAWITGRRLFERAAAWLFRFTGQAALDWWEDRLFVPVQQARFTTQVDKKVLGPSTLLTVKATKG